MSRGMQSVVYVTSSDFKVKENDVFSEVCRLADGSFIRDCFTFEHRSIHIKEILEVDLYVMVAEEATKAYSQIKVPCIVEHAGLIFEGYESVSYPGGLTKPMWNALGDKFSEETHSADRRAIARAVIAYCDGKSVRTFDGETRGTLAPKPRGSRKFYWDTIFVPDSTEPAVMGKTFAEIVDDPDLGLRYKMAHLSQSSKAMINFLEYFRAHPRSDLWAAGV